VVTFRFPTPIDYDGTSNLMVDFSFNNTSATAAGIVRVSPMSASRTLYAAVNSTNGDPLT